MKLSSGFRPVSFDDIPGWTDDDHLAAFSAFRLSALRAMDKTYRTGSLGIEASAFEPAFVEARASPPDSPEQARRFFEAYFRPFVVSPDDGADWGFVTGFYEPEVDASAVPTSRFKVPLLTRPRDLVDVTEAARPPGLDTYLAFARKAPSGELVEYHDRQAIERGALAGEGLEIAWLEHAVDAFFIHVQGAARLRMPDGTVRRVTYAAKSGQRFTGPGRVLAELGEIPPAEVTMQSIRSWFERNPERVAEVLWQNRSYIFFCEAPVDDPALGPIAAAKVPLTPGRSLAVDRLLHTFATPFFIEAPSLTALNRKPFRRLMIAQDTGSAIVGRARGDLFCGSGDAAGEIAGIIRHPARFFALLPKGLTGANPAG